ncbi:hypothetical protein ACE1SV_54320 [Streptomyces sennicomposti]
MVLTAGLLTVGADGVSRGRTSSMIDTFRKLLTCINASLSGPKAALGHGTPERVRGSFAAWAGARSRECSVRRSKAPHVYWCRARKRGRLHRAGTESRTGCAEDPRTDGGGP